jgi:hypothetical protein
LQRLVVLRPRTHTALLDWDERYRPYLNRAGFEDLVRVILSGLPPLDLGLLTALVDRWRPETHTFHLQCGEMTVTLQDTAMILGLPVEGTAVTGEAVAAWPAMVEAMLGIAPPARVAGDRTSYVT